MESFKGIALCHLLVALFIVSVQCDTPANCTYEDVVGTWRLFIGDKAGDKTMDCSSLGKLGAQVIVKLSFPNVATDEFGNKGFWTMVYNQGFEIVVHGRKYFAFSKYTGTAENATSFCDQTMPGWSHDVLGHEWRCYNATKSEVLPPKPTKRTQHQNPNVHYQHNREYISNLNAIQTTWKAVHYKEHETMTLEDVLRRNGGRKSAIVSPKPAKASSGVKAAADKLPVAWDWTNVEGTSFVSPVRNQGACGSCYAFSALGMNEARQLVMSQGKVNITFSPQDIVECSKYSQGCDGGFPYLIGGKYAEDYGLVAEDCDPYTGNDGPCSTSPSCPRHYSTNYRYIGGYYGGCNAEEMQLALYRNGPVAVAFEVYNDFMNYKGGVYQHTGLEDKFNPFEITNHAVLLVGWGKDHESGLDFWKVKNSWGEKWGEEGYFRIRRGVDECSIESIAVESSFIF